MDELEEVFKPYPYSDYILVGSHGTIKAKFKYKTYRTNPTMLAEYRTLPTYMYKRTCVVRCVHILNDVNSPEEQVHRIVAQTFVNGYKHGLFCVHLDGNIYNNHFKNLQWLTLNENRTRISLLKNNQKVYAQI